MPRSRSIGLSLDAAGPLPMYAITEWMIADAPAYVDLEEDTFGNLVGEGETANDIYHGGEPTVTVIRHVDSSYGKNLTNFQWAKKFVQELLQKCPENIVWISRSHKNPAYICVRKRKDENDNDTTTHS